jgi:hypothetical protein
LEGELKIRYVVIRNPLSLLEGRRGEADGVLGEFPFEIGGMGVVRR